ncbi:hypothetical protein Tco_0333103 [Tanacetum coccineum]
MNRRKKHFSKLRAEEIRRKPPTKAQKKNQMSTYLKNMAGYKHSKLKSKIYDEIQKLFDKEMKRVNTFVEMNSEVVKGSETRTEESSKRSGDELESDMSKKQKVDEHVEVEKDDDQEEAEMKMHIEIVKDDEVSIDAIPLATKPPVVEENYVEALQVKYPIIDWEVYSEDTRKYWKIIRVENYTRAYQTLDDMLQKFDRDDLDKLWSLVKERLGSIDPTDDKERTLWVELKRLFKPDIDDILWKLQRYMNDPLTWKLYDTCGVHHVSTDRGHDIFMLVEKDYLLTRGILTLMLCNKLQVDQYSEMANKFLKKIFILVNGPRQ